MYIGNEKWMLIAENERKPEMSNDNRRWTMITGSERW